MDTYKSQPLRVSNSCCRDLCSCYEILIWVLGIWGCWGLNYWCRFSCWEQWSRVLDLGKPSGAVFLVLWATVSERTEQGFRSLCVGNSLFKLLSLKLSVFAWLFLRRKNPLCFLVKGTGLGDVGKPSRFLQCLCNSGPFLLLWTYLGISFRGKSSFREL